jgi:cell wall-associated NlpC family hydrolase
MCAMSARVLLAAATLAAVTSACASTGAVPHPFPTPGGAPPGARVPGSESGAVVPAPTTGAIRRPLDGYALTTTALSLRGAPYRNGGSDPSGFDCSGFTQYVFAQYGVALPREVREQYRVGTAVNADQLTAGDLLFFATTDPGASHVAIAIGGDEFVHAPSSTGVVRVERLGSTYWSQRFLGARRLN